MRTRTPRWLTIVTVALLTALAPITMVRADPRDELAAGEASVSALQQRLEILSERVNTAQARLDSIEGRLADARDVMEAARRDADRVRAQLSQHAVAAYVGAGSELEGWLGAADFSDLSDRLEYAGALAQNDADLATRADVASQRAQWAAEQYAQVAAEQRSALADLDAQQRRFRTELEQQQAHVEGLRQAYRTWLADQRAAAEAAARQQRHRTEAAADRPGGGRAGSGGGGGSSDAGGDGGGDGGSGAGGGASTDHGGGGDGGGGGGSAPPPDISAASVAIASARSQIGVPYVWGTANPNTSFDCSGLTSWAWGRAGVSLPHSSAMQASMTPDVSRDELRPGDLVFFYQPISHVGLYIGGGRMIDASHAGPGGEVDIRNIYWDSFTIGGRVQ